jgi:hypothetical protein
MIADGAITNVPLTCPNCAGTGVEVDMSKSTMKDCPACRGDGFNRTLDGTPGNWVTLIATTQFRWLRRTVELHPFYSPNTGTALVLQQMYQGSDGTQQWQDVPTVDETQV